jgi:hypothetical protein
MPQYLSEDYSDHRLEICIWFFGNLNERSTFSKDCVLFNDEANFYVNGEVNRQNMRYCLSPTKQGADRIIVWCGIYDNIIHSMEQKVSQADNRMWNKS